MPFMFYIYSFLSKLQKSCFCPFVRSTSEDAASRKFLRLYEISIKPEENHKSAHPVLKLLTGLLKAFAVDRDQSNNVLKPRPDVVNNFFS